MVGNLQEFNLGIEKHSKTNRPTSFYVVGEDKTDLILDAVVQMTDDMGNCKLVSLPFYR